MVCCICSSRHQLDLDLNVVCSFRCFGFPLRTCLVSVRRVGFVFWSLASVTSLLRLFVSCACVCSLEARCCAAFLCAAAVGAADGCISSSPQRTSMFIVSHHQRDFNNKLILVEKCPPTMPSCASTMITSVIGPTN